MIKCPNCQTELFRADKQRNESPGVIVVRLTCAKCGHRLQVWVENAAIKELAKEIKAYNERLHDHNNTIQNIIDYETKSWWRKLLGGRWMQ